MLFVRFFINKFLYLIKKQHRLFLVMLLSFVSANANDNDTNNATDSVVEKAVDSDNVSNKNVHYYEFMYPAIEKEIARVKQGLSGNTVSDAQHIENTKNLIDEIWQNLKRDGLCSTTGSDKDLRPAYVIMQAILERAQISMKHKGKISSLKMITVTPRMPTTLILNKDMSLETMDLAVQKSFAYYRHPIVLEFLRNKGKYYAFYSREARKYISYKHVKRYDKVFSLHNNLLDRGILDVSIKDFPSFATGAMYFIDNAIFAVIDSRQVGQQDSDNSSTWMIRIGSVAEERIKNFKEVFKELSEAY